MDQLQKKYDSLVSEIKSLKSVAVAFSGGVDSVFLLHAAKEALGEQVIAITAVSATFPERETNEARELCKNWNVRQKMVEFDEMSVEGFAQNPPDRCYLCKYQLFTKICAVAKENGALEILEGSNADDEKDYRPGLKAIAELKVMSPLRKIGFTKQEIRTLLKQFGIETFKKPSFACLATRIPYGDLITTEKLKKIDAAEQFLISKGFEGVRVRIHGELARIEVVQEDIARLCEPQLRNETVDFMKQLGFMYVTMDMNGYRQGSMNAPITGN